MQPPHIQARPTQTHIQACSIYYIYTGTVYTCGNFKLQFKKFQQSLSVSLSFIFHFQAVSVCVHNFFLPPVCCSIGVCVCGTVSPHSVTTNINHIIDIGVQFYFCAIYPALFISTCASLVLFSRWIGAAEYKPIWPIMYAYYTQNAHFFFEEH